MASKNERAEKRAALIELMDQGCLENSRGALVGTGMWVVPKKERRKRRLTPGYQDGGRGEADRLRDKRSHLPSSLDDGETELSVSPSPSRSQESRTFASSCIIMISDALANTMVSAVGMGPDRA